MKDPEGASDEGGGRASSRDAELPLPLERLSEGEIERKRCIVRITTYVMRDLTSTFLRSGFEWMLPVVLSKSTDPLWPDPGASIEKRIEVEIYDETVRATLSMIIHKMVACSLTQPRLFLLSPNIRIERRDRATSGVHIYEFTQLDFEVRDATSEDIRILVEGALHGLIDGLRRDMREELTSLSRYDGLRPLRVPFEVYDKEELEDKYGDEWESQLAAESRDPVWVTNIPREFYDYEDLEKGKWDNYDLFLPGFGEVLSGARREWDYTAMVRKMERDGVPPENYRLLLKLAREGRLKPSAGAGIGLERLISWIVGAQHIAEVQPFPKIPGTIYDL
ncbi:MAG: asparagine synthetase A [Thermoplasmata archaeon]